MDSITAICDICDEDDKTFELPICEGRACQDCFADHLKSCWECCAVQREEEAAYTDDRSVRF